MDSKPSPPLIVFFVPLLARGHTLPCVEAARLFAERGIRSTVVTAPGNSTYFLPTIEQAKTTGLPLHLLHFPFPAVEVGLPAGLECSDSLPPGNDNIAKFYKGVGLLRDPFEKLVIEHRPDLIVSDMFWSFDVAISLSIPHFAFHAISAFSKCIVENLLLTGSHLSNPDSDTVPVVGLPHPLQLTRPEVPIVLNWPHLIEKAREADGKSCGVLLNSFDELAPEYTDHFRKNLIPGSTAKVWCIGPVQLNNNIVAVNQGAGNWEGIKNWLDSKDPESVLYVSFGSECSFSAEELREIAVGLESCKHSFIWVLRGGAKAIEEEFGPRLQGKGLIITEWAPQVAILNHWAMGGFVMHCGWNSTLESICAGLPVIAWPLHSEQFINERLVVEILGVGLRLLEGPKMRSLDADTREAVKGEMIRAAVDRLMGGTDEEVRAVRRKAKRYGELARSAMEKGGSSYVNLGSAIEEMTAIVKQKKGNIKTSGEGLSRPMVASLGINGDTTRDC